MADWSTSTRPVLWLDNWGRGQALLKSGKATRLLSAQAGPRWRRQGDGWVWACAPALDDLRAVQAGDITPDEYFNRCQKLWGLGKPLSHLAPGSLRVYRPDGGLLPDPDWTWMDRSHVRDGDVFCCTCAAPGSPKRTHRCHLEALAPLLDRAGNDHLRWDIRLYGQPWPAQQHQQTPAPRPAPKPATSAPPRRLSGRQRPLLEIA